MPRHQWRFVSGLLRQPALLARRDLNAATWFSFDIFDTLVKRDTASFSNVFHLVAHSAGLDPDVFVPARRRAEEAAQQANADYSFADIYRELAGFGDSQRELAAAEEQRLEIELSTRNRAFWPLFEQVRATGLPYVLISDMYLPVSTIEQIVRKAGVSGYQHLFVSSDVAASKRDGALFRRAARTMDLPLSGLVHLGDSPRRDFLMPRRVGARSILIRREIAARALQPRGELLQRVDGGTLIAGLGDTESRRVDADLGAFLDNRRLPTATDPFEQFGYDALGPLFFGFSRWLHEQCQSLGLEHLVFVARDGLIMQRSYHKAMGNGALPTTYLQASRRSLRLAAFAGREHLLPNELFFSAPRRTATEVLNELGMDQEQSGRALAAAGVEADAGFDRVSYHDSADFRRLLDVALPTVQAIATQQRELLSDYLSQLGVSGRIALIDSGWSGTVQAYLQEAADLPLEIDGFYLAIASGARERARVTPMRMHGYLADFAKHETDGYLLDVMLGFIEAWLYAPHGSTVGYQRDDSGSVSPVLGPIDNANAAGNGQVLRAQAAALSFVEDYSRSPLAGRPLPAASAFGRFEAVALSPSRRLLSAFGEITNNGKRLAPRPHVGYLRSPSAFLGDFGESRWKAAFLRRSLRLPLAYNRLYLLGLRHGFGSTKGRTLHRTAPHSES